MFLNSFYGSRPVAWLAVHRRLQGDGRGFRGGLLQTPGDVWPTVSARSRKGDRASTRGAARSALAVYTFTHLYWPSKRRAAEPTYRGVVARASRKDPVPKGAGPKVGQREGL